MARTVAVWAQRPCQCVFSAFYFTFYCIVNLVFVCTSSFLYCGQRSSILLDLSTETSALPQRKDGPLGVCRCVSECVEGGVSRRWRWTGCWVFLTRPLYVCSTVWLSRDWCCCWICHCRLPIIAPVYHTHTLCPENCMYVQVSLRPENLQYEIWYL